MSTEQTIQMSMEEIIDAAEKKMYSSHSIMADLNQLFEDLRNGLENHKLDDSVVHRLQVIAILDIVLAGPDVKIRARVERIRQELNEYSGVISDMKVEHIKSLI